MEFCVHALPRLVLMFRSLRILAILVVPKPSVV